MKPGNLNFLEPSGPHWACYGTPPYSVETCVQNVVRFVRCNFGIFRLRLLTMVAMSCP